MNYQEQAWLLQQDNPQLTETRSTNGGATGSNWRRKSKQQELPEDWREREKAYQEWLKTRYE